MADQFSPNRGTRGTHRPDPRAPRRPDGPPPAPDAQAGRMAPITHAGPLPWVQLRNAVFHPSIFRKMVGRVDPRACNGDLVAVYDRDAVRFGTGLLSTQAQYGLRMLTFNDSPIDETFIEQRIAAAARLRREILKLDDVSDAYRVVHAEGDALPGLMIDRFGDTAVAEVFNFPMFRRADAIREACKKVLGVTDVLIRADERVQNAEGFFTPGDAPGATENRRADRKSTVITENGVRFQIDLTHGHKTGFFCDQRDNRRALTQFTPGADVLDLCCYTGGFGVYAATLGRASRVTCVDLDEDAIALAQRNANLNQVPRSVLSTAHSDVFPYMRQLQASNKQFDVVILDPPKLIANSDEFAEGRAKYFDLNKLAVTVVKPGGMLITCSCSGLLSPEEFFSVLRGAPRSSGRRVQVLQSTGAGPDHPVMTEAPESAYLKCLWCRIW